VNKINYCFGCVLFIPVVCLHMCVLFYFYLVSLHVCAYAFKSRVHCGSALEPGASGLPYYCTFICVRACLLGVDLKKKIVVALWIQTQKKKAFILDASVVQ